MIIGLLGYAGTGKDEVAKIISEYTGAEVKRFAGKLKTIATLLTGIPEEKWEDRAFKLTNLSSEWGNMPVREFLQRLGTDAIRNNIHENAWVNALMSEYKKLDILKGLDYPDWVIPDVRFTNEADAIIERGGYLIRVTRPGVGPVNGHISEMEIDTIQCHATINNDGTLNDLKTNVWNTLKKLETSTSLLPGR